MVFGHLLYLAAAQKVNSAIADVRNEALVADREKGAERRAHPALVRIGEGVGVNFRARTLHGVLDEGHDVFARDLVGACGS